MPEDVNPTVEEPTVLPEGEAEAEEAHPAPGAGPAPKRGLAPGAPRAPGGDRPPGPPQAARAGGGAPSLDFILDLPLEISVELGRATMPVGDLLQLGQGSVLELNKLASEPLEVLVNHKLVARGEAVVINEKFGVRILDVVSAEERVRRLG